MELTIIQYCLAIPLWIYLISIPLRIILQIVDLPKTLGFYNVNIKKWKKF